jgi:hypothetical protein
MGGRRGGRAVSDKAETVTPFSARARKSSLDRKLLRWGAFAGLLVVAAVPIFFQADAPSVAANDTVKCHDRFGNDEPCVTQGSAAATRSTARTTGTSQPAAWIATAPYQPTTWTTTALDPPAGWTTSPPAAQPNATPHKRAALGKCRRGLVSCFFSSVRKGVAHIATAVAAAGQPRPATKDHL